jgi:ketosteroid isomerase-like protein
MKKIYLLIALLFLFFAKAHAQKQPAVTADQWKEKLQVINKELADAFVNKNIDAFMKYYDDKAPTCMPEYHMALYTKQGIAYYYQQWFDNVTINNYKRDIYEVRLIKTHLVEIGTFVNNFTKPDGSSLQYDGKYMNVWSIAKDQKLTLISEIWGANNAVDKSNFSFIKPQASIMPKLTINKTIADVISKRNDLIAKFVKKREGEKHAIELFTKDAIYMTYDTPMLVGMDNIKPYFTEHEKPNDISINSMRIRASTMINLVNFVIEYGYYYVDFSVNNKKEKTIVTGKSTNLWKKDDTGVWMLYRQMVNHD